VPSVSDRGIGVIDAALSTHVSPMSKYLCVTLIDVELSCHYTGDVAAGLTKEAIMALSLACKDVGQNCSFKAEAATEEELLKKVSQHAKQAHGMATIDQATMAKVKGAIKKV
jgi:predicted small metal-binding protein